FRLRRGLSNQEEPWLRFFRIVPLRPLLGFGIRLALGSAFRLARPASLCLRDQQHARPAIEMHILPRRSDHAALGRIGSRGAQIRSEEHTSELQSRGHLVCRLLLEKKKTTRTTTPVL